MSFRRFLFLLILFAAAAALGIGFGLRSYRVFTGEQLIATVECLPAPPDSGFNFRLRLTPVVSGGKELARTYGIYGQQWMAGGEYLKWHSWLNLLGVKNRYKLTRLSGRYIDASNERYNPRAVYALNGGTGEMWLLLYKIQNSLPFVEAVYGNAAYTLAEPGGTWGIYITHSGYIIRRLPPK